MNTRYRQDRVEIIDQVPLKLAQGI